MYDFPLSSALSRGAVTERTAASVEPPLTFDGVAGVAPPRARSRHRQGLYLPVSAKFALAVALASLWAALSIWLSQGWLADLAHRWGWLFAVGAVTFIAYVPGFMNAFIVATLLNDKRPPRRALARYPGVSVLIACYNEEQNIGDTLASLAIQDYLGELDILLLNDGSTDGTVAAVRAAVAKLNFPLGRSIRIVDFPKNAGKASVLNYGLKVARHPLIVTVDGDCWLVKDSLSHIVERLMADPADTVAVAGSVLVKNSRRNWLTRAQEWDYFNGIAAVKRMQSMYHGTLVAQGAFSLYRREALESVGGWPSCVGEDIVVTWALLKAGHRVGYAEDALVFTNVPHTVRQFANQRKRWSRGLIEAFKAHGDLLRTRRLTTLFIWWNLCFLPIDLVYTFVFIPGLVLALMGDYIIAGPMTLLVLPLALLWNFFVCRLQRRMFHRQGLTVRRNIGGFVFYAFAYSLLMQPVCVWGYVDELLGLRKTWGTK